MNDSIRALAVVLALGVAAPLWAASEVAPAVPNLTLPDDTDKAAKTPRSAKKTSRKTASAAKKAVVPPAANPAAKINTETVTAEALPAAAVQTEETAVQPVSVPENALLASAPDGFVAAREAEPAAAGEQKTKRVVYNPPSDRDPTLSPDDTLLLKAREEARLRAIEMEKQRKIDEERQRLAEIERQRQLELERLRDPSREVRNKIRINGIVGQEVFIGNKVYTVGKTVQGARIVRVLPDSVVFTYKGQRFTKKVQLK